MQGTILEDVLHTMSDDEIVDLYKQLKAINEQFYAASKLRTAFINHKLKDFHNIDWSGVIKYFIEEESEYLKGWAFKVQERNGFVLNEDIDASSTHINGFLQAKLMKEGVKEGTAIDASVCHVNQGYCIGADYYEKVLSNLFMDTYTDKNDFMFNTMVGYANYYLPTIVGIKADSDRNQPALESEKHTEHAYNSIPPADLKLRKHKDIRMGMITLFAYNWFRDNLISAEYFLIKALSMTPENDFLYEIMSFIQKDLFTRNSQS